MPNALRHRGGRVCLSLLLMFSTALLMPTRIGAQHEHLFQQYDARDGLSDAWVSAIVQDARGFIWIGTQYGLNRFDGYRFRWYTYNPDDTTSISGNWVRSICEDREGQLWLSNYGEGVSRFDPDTERARRFRHDPDDSTSLAGRRVMQVICDRQGRIWFATDHGVCWYDKDRDAFRRFATGFTYALAEDLQGRIWAGTQDGLLVLDTMQQQFRSAAPLTGSVAAVCGLDGGLMVVEDQRLKQMTLVDGKWTVTSTSVLPQQHPNDHFYPPLLRDTRGRIWTSDGHRLAMLGVTGPTTHFRTNGEVLAGNGGQSYLTCLAEDRQGNLWIGTNRGLSVYRPTLGRFQRSRYQEGLGGIPMVREIMTFGDTVWYGSPEGLFRKITGRPGSGERVSDQSVYAICPGEHGQLYATTEYAGQLTRVDRSTLKQSTIMVPPVNNRDTIPRTIFALARDQAGRLWIGNQESLQCYDPVAGSTFPVYLSDQDDGVLTLELLIDNTQRLWIATLGHGLYMIEDIHSLGPAEPASLRHFMHVPQVTNTLSSNAVQSLHEDLQGRIWAGTDGGLNRYDPETRAFHRYLRRHGLVNDKITSMSSDVQGRLWLSTVGQGIVCFDVDRGTFYNFTTDDGLYSNDFMLSSGCRANDGTIFFGAEGGLQIFHPDAIFQMDTSEVPLLFSDIQIAGRTLMPGDDTGILGRSTIATRRVTFDHRQSAISVQFAALHFSQPQKTEYAYQMHAPNGPWQQLGTRQDINFANLKPGRYQMAVRGQNPVLGWTARSPILHIRVLPPWWRSTWAWVLYALVVLTGLYLLYRAQMQRQLEQAEARRLREMDAMKTRLYTNITHEFRTPLTVILGMAGKILDQSQNALREQAHMIQRNGRQLLRLINQMLDLAKLESGLMAVNYVQGDIVKYVQYLTESFYSLAGAKDVRLHLHCAQDTWLMDFDPDKWQQIFSNLLSNAIKYTPPGGEVAVHTDGSGRWFTCTIRDTGVGIPQEKLAHIFDRFYRVEETAASSANPQEAGTGIGLTVTHELVKSLGGEITVTSSPAAGTAFTVTLPVTNNAPKAAPPESGLSVNMMAEQGAETLVDEDLAGFDDTRPLLLLVEDNADVVRYLTTCLQADYRLVVARNGREGIDMALQTIPDLIISDVMMPKKDGFEVCATLKEDDRTRHIPIILLTARADVPSRLEGLAHGADAYLPKPFNEEELLLRLRKLFELRRKLQVKYTRSDVTLPSENKEDAFVGRVRELVHAHLDDTEFGIEQLCLAMGISRPHLHRKLKALTGKSTSHFIRLIRLQQARQLLRQSQHNVSEVAYAVGFKDPAYFSRLFSEEFGVPPSGVRGS
ncbi:MAG: two-component regulator propeller domain-containing protein [Saprospiraceae bacterium]|nr:two-component regulator propeller domain-containing protein [Saprospiraceae bacterium]